MKDIIVEALKKQTKLKANEIENLIEIPPTKDLGDYAFPCFILSKKLKKSPNEIASSLSKKIKFEDLEKVEAKGPYVNFFINRSTLARKTIPKILKERNNYGSSGSQSQKIMVEFSQANTHKAFHVGHVRGTSLGESISRILEFSGNKVIRANYQGDTGMHVAKWLWCYKNFHKKEKIRNEEAWIAKIYVDAVKRLEKKPELQIQVDEINRKLESKKDRSLNSLWKDSRKKSLEAFGNIYSELNTKFDTYFFESEMELAAKKISESLFKKKIAEISDGATIVDLKKYDLGIWVLLRRDGTILYSSKDLALAEEKFKKYKIDKSIYLVGNAQRLHFRQLFKTLELMKFKKSNNLSYVPITEVRFPWGRMSSRTGDNVLYSDFKKDLIDYARKEIKKRDKLSKAELEERALAISIASMKYSMLKQDTNKALIFNKEEALRFEGNTGPYLLYTYARARSILKKARYKSGKLTIKKISDKEKDLIFYLAKFPDVIKSASTSIAPNLIANYAYGLAQSFNEFYHTSKVIGSDQESLRLSLVDSTSQVLKNALFLLGIETLERM